ncbi:hypothetical protein COLO4_09744 [Corchorus olitorius]|uniref:Uncharacterized protein n=1 Tax=Corchorus olitorius TaxID=93759 RepID=A0A1R3KB62_9ROSI|nr:hypothetical protein COLO4_09744 [Corchorus olitorius]
MAIHHRCFSSTPPSFPTPSCRFVVSIVVPI